MALESYGSFEELKGRLDEIVEAVNDKDLPLDQALSLYEEAVGLGLRASDLLEQGIDEASVQEALASDAPAELADGTAQSAASAADAHKEGQAGGGTAQQGQAPVSA
ncbi:exodeoxyribonuclease VII small subunit [uncultured Senegalimassilia sp.]|uniref:exodeoxyribonuclease VII small subunit n=1 Tax=uncultured Senegalimassilia sp. TaxID=1714350 RepID=UPI0027DCA9AA|nr:exodeoxyribonuclease VII small subunit [uncultured Senegalimassilia sp.]